MQRAFEVALLMLGLAASGCSQDLGYSAPPSRADNTFTGLVWPVLVRDCGFQACHGSSERFFRIFGRGRSRYTEKDVPLPGPYDPLNGFERDSSWHMAESMIDPDNPGDSLLLRKPLAVEAGGSDHEGVDKYGRNVYRTPDAEGYLTIARWVFSVAPQMAAARTAGAAGKTATPTSP